MPAKKKKAAPARRSSHHHNGNPSVVIQFGVVFVIVAAIALVAYVFKWYL